MNYLSRDEESLFRFKAPYVSLSQLSFSVPVSQSFPKQAIPLSLPSICSTLTISFFWLDLRSRSEQLQHSYASSTPSDGKRETGNTQKYTEHLSNMALRAKRAVLKMNIPRTRKSVALKPGISKHT